MSEFIGDVCTVWVRHSHEMILLREFSFIDSKGLIWTAPSGALINGASIPKNFWSTIGGPYSGLYREASVLHDYYCTTKERGCRETHKMFYEGCIEGGVEKHTAQIMYLSVKHFGPKW